MPSQILELAPPDSCGARLWVRCVVGMGVLIALTGCDSSFEPFTESDFHFTILGYLDTDADTQFVRVVPFRPVVERLRTEAIDAEVRSIDLDAGITRAWQDSIIHFADSSYGHVFWSRFRALPGHKYRIEVERADGSLTWAETLVPLRPVDPDSVYGALNESADFAPLFWPGVDDVIEADVLYDIAPYNCGTLAYPPPLWGRYEYRLPYEGQDRGRSYSGGWRFEFHLWADQDTLISRLRSIGHPARSPLCSLLYRLEVRLATPSAEFDPPGGVWDREVLMQPGTLSNVHGGLGFVGSVVRTTVNWILTPIAQQALGYEQQ